MSDTESILSSSVKVRCSDTQEKSRVWLNGGEKECAGQSDLKQLRYVIETVRCDLEPSGKWKRGGMILAKTECHLMREWVEKLLHGCYTSWL